MPGAGFATGVLVALRVGVLEAGAMLASEGAEVASIGADVLPAVGSASPLVPPVHPEALRAAIANTAANVIRFKASSLFLVANSGAVFAVFGRRRYFLHMAGGGVYYRHHFGSDHMQLAFGIIPEVFHVVAHG